MQVFAGGAPRSKIEGSKMDRNYGNMKQGSSIQYCTDNGRRTKQKEREIMMSLGSCAHTHAHTVE